MRVSIQSTLPNDSDKPSVAATLNSDNFAKLSETIKTAQTVPLSFHSTLNHDDNMAPIDLDIESMQAMMELKAQVDKEFLTLEREHSMHSLMVEPATASVLAIDNHRVENQLDSLPVASISSTQNQTDNIVMAEVSTNRLTNSSDTHLITSELTSAIPQTNPQSVQTPIQNTIISDTIVALPDRRDVEPTSLSRRLIHGVLVGLLYALIGLLIDWLVNLAKVFSGVNSAEMVWFFMPIFGVMGVVFGLLFGTKALDVIFGLFRTIPTENNPSHDDDSFSSGLFKAIGLGLLIGIIGWFLLMLMA